MLNLRRWSVARSLLLSLGAIAVLGLSSAAAASTYGSGAYGNCAYGTGCPASSAKGSTPATATAPAAPSAILQNDFSEYFSPGGKDLTLIAGQIVYFDITVGNVVQHHSVTIKAIGPDYVDIVVASTPIEDRLSITESHRYEVTGDNQDDIQITLKSITDGKALMNFRALQAAVPTPATTVNNPHFNWWWLWLILFGLCLIIGIWWFVWLRRRKRRTTAVSTNQPPPAGSA